jgi:pimeloyl-ACP methyl ester carboxylesterase
MAAPMGAFWMTAVVADPGTHQARPRVIYGGDLESEMRRSQLRKGELMSETTSTAPTTVVLVHGAFADASSWNGVIARLQAKGVPVMAPANPLRGIAADSAYMAAVLEQIEGPVVAVGHSYGGAVITNAATTADNVVALVYVAAFAPEEGEALGAAAAASKDSVLSTALIPRQYPTADGGPATEFYIDPAKARDAFASDVSDEQAALIGATQRPVAELAFSEASGPPAWKGRPSWAVIATADRAAGTDVTRSMAERAGATITEIDGSHVIMISQPQAVTDVILAAVASVASAAVESAR